MANIKEEAKELKVRLKKVTDLSTQLKSEVKALDDGLARQMRAPPQKYHTESVNRAQITCIDEILRRVEGLNDTTTCVDSAENKKKWTRLQNGGSSVETMKTTKNISKPEQKIVPSVHGNKVARQSTFDNLYKHAEIRTQKLEILSQKVKEKENEAIQKSRPKNKNVKIVVGRRVRDKEIDIANMDARVQEIMKNELEDFEIAKARRKKKWAREKREAAVAETAASAAAMAAAASALQPSEIEQETPEVLSSPEQEKEKQSQFVDHNNENDHDVNNSITENMSSYESRFDYGIGYSEIVDSDHDGDDQSFSNDKFNNHKSNTTFDYVGALDAVDKVSLEFHESNFKFPDDNLLASKDNEEKKNQKDNFSLDFGKEALDELLEFSKDLRAS